ncbi:FKBP-type peptidyl-prolyl cis-trans isomerase FklB [Thiohalospira halophila DSM 15071]|uniref:Peptidyl-prolyl cis-trans isomerase n=1 Tax=Thiohalospira halophila DSM 15071 TaxID=1123397 RepID=A0A1I1NXX2_9GAMM|nr:FKBP-type peptidyl-prolyl cis-trans isomerase [Thiohalospira halophila]SFD00348.1 FKBP-type peptidyl-prolyl cis-trans isomerase FklB [Thiohalospira halophila DSM 15071]
MNRLTILLPAGLMALAGCNGGGSEPDLESDEARHSYAVGWQVGQNIQRSGMELDGNAVAAAIRDALEGQDPALDQEAMQAAMQAAQQKRMDEQRQEAESNREAGGEYLEEFKAGDGVQVSEDGVAWKVLEAGDGDSPAAGDTVRVHYHGETVDGEVFDSSRERGEPVTFPTDSVIKGWQQVLPKMKEGGKWQVVIPPEMAYGEQGAGPAIGPGETLIFEIELLEADAE